jgi:hypothetical protein
MKPAMEIESPSRVAGRYDHLMQTSAQPPLLRYAVLWHDDVDEPHFDFLVETRPGSDLATWRVPHWPVTGRAEATRLRDHRRIYLDYTGELSGQRGRVQRIDGGSCQLEIGEDALWKIVPEGGMRAISFRQVSGDQWIAEA